MATIEEFLNCKCNLKFFATIFFTVLFLLSSIVLCKCDDVNHGAEVVKDPLIVSKIGPDVDFDVQNTSSLDFDKYLNIVDQSSTPSSINVIPDEPLQLIRPDFHHKKLVIVEENLKYLQNLNVPVSTVSVVGKFHSGKSFLMNQIMSKSNGFGIGKLVTPKTMGIWAWGKPMKITSQTGSDEWMLLLDTEGFAANNISENYDAKIFAVSTLLSSKLLYNSVKIIDQSDIDYLELLARRTQLFALKSQMTPHDGWAEEFSAQLLQFPSLIWVIQDFVQETSEACREWLVKLLSSHAREAELYEISLKDIFSHVDCHTMFIPSAEKQFLTDLSRANEENLTSDYRKERDELIAKIKSDIKPKEKNGKPITGTDLALLLRVLVDSANAGSLTEIPNRWDAFLERIQQSSVEECFNFFKVHMKSWLDPFKSEPVNGRKLQQWFEKSYKKSFNLLSHLLHGLNEPILTKSQRELNETITYHYMLMEEANQQKIRIKLFNLQKNYEIKIAEQYQSLQLPLLTADIEKFFHDLGVKIKAEYSDEVFEIMEHDQEGFTSNLQALDRSNKLNFDSAVLKNNQKLNLHLDVIRQRITDQTFKKIAEAAGFDVLKTSVGKKVPLLFKEIETIINKSIQNSIDSFDRQADQFKQEVAIYEAQLNKLKLTLMNKATEFRENNNQFFRKYLEDEASALVFDFEQQTSPEKLNFPIKFSDLQDILKEKLSKAEEMFANDYGKYSDYPPYGEVVNNYVETLKSICENRRKENLNAFKIEVEQPLNLAKKLIMLSGDRYRTWYSYRHFIFTSCLLHFEEGKAKDWSLGLKKEIISSFIQDDPDLSRELERRHGFWSRFVGFFQWLLYLIWGD